jgi:uncharacterized LabA/DUF88 family protein
MVFVDGENFAIRFGSLINGRALDEPWVYYKPDIYVWSRNINDLCAFVNVIRKHYYTSTSGDENAIAGIQDTLKDIGIEAPRVFKRQKNGRSKRVDITLATEMLTHAHRKNYDVAILIAGDEDYLPLVEAVQGEGARVFLWFFKNGLSPKLKRTVDNYVDIEYLFFQQILFI